MKVSTLKPRLRRSLYRAGLYLKQAFLGMKAMLVKPAPLPRSVPVHAEDGAASRFFFIVVEVPDADQELIRLMQVPPSLAAAIQLPDGCRFRTCFEISAEYANVIINL